MLEIRNLAVEANGKEILHDVNLNIGDSKVYALFGPNGSGKSTLLNVIMGVAPYKVSGGSILFNDKNIARMTIDERVRAGIAVAFQSPPEIKGVTLRDMINICLKRKPGTDLDGKTMLLVNKFMLEDFLDRYINVDFSGGERKRADLLQLLLLKPKFLMLDEPDSGVDIVSLRLICEEINAYIEKSKASALLITHQGEVLNYIKAGSACILFKGTNYCYKSPQRILKDIKEHGYEGCVNCQVHQSS